MWTEGEIKIELINGRWQASWCITDMVDCAMFLACLCLQVPQPCQVSSASVGVGSLCK